ncbi:type II secretion system F family protein [Pseudobdellovibrio sp. HCB154]|uniref:type II secretion system F family protein n=1 Tax=Pseudobdellovibrio sp. HCB154 TaxID=3386277 RepID=UPI00391748D9
MAKFQFQARSLNGKIQTGYLDAKDESEAKVRLRAKQLMPMTLKVVTNIPGKKNAHDIGALGAFFAPKVKTKDLQIFTRQFATLINSGIPIVDALKILSESTSDKLIKEAVLQIKASIETGKRLSDSMKQFPRVFDDLYCNMIRAGEEAGIIDVILNRLSVYSEKNEKIKNQIKGAMAMPIVIVIAAVLVISGIIVFIIPKFQELYKGSGKELPGLTQMLINMSDALRNHWLGIFIGIFVAIYFIISFFASKEGRQALDKFLINAPVIGDVVQKASVARLSRTMSTLLSSGISMLESIDIAANTAGNYVIENALKSCKESISVGRPFHLPLSRQKEIPQMVSQMVAIGEQTGALDSMLGKIADFYEDEVENAIRAMTSLIEPLLMIVLGGIIGFILVAMYLPVFQMGDTVVQ